MRIFMIQVKLSLLFVVVFTIITQYEIGTTLNTIGLHPILISNDVKTEKRNRVLIIFLTNVERKY